MIRILHLQTELNLACGVTRTISQIVKNTSSEFEHHLIVLGGDGLKRFDSLKIKPTIFNLNRNSFTDTIKILTFIAKYCKKNSIDIVHSHHRYFDSMSWILKPFIKIKTITSVQSKVYRRKLFSYKADKLIACSNNIKDHLIKEFEIAGEKIVVIHNSVDPKEINTKLDKEILRNELQINPTKKIIGFAGRFDFKEKGIDLLLKSFSAVNKIRNDVQLLLVGNGINRFEIESFINSVNIPCTVIDAQENIFDYINLMDILVLPSRVEPFGIIMLETGLIKIPFIGSKVDGIAELIDHEKDGILFESENVDDLAKQILRIMNDKKFANSLAENLHQKVINSFTVDKIIPQYERIYLDVLQ